MRIVSRRARHSVHYTRPTTWLFDTFSHIKGDTTARLRGVDRQRVPRSGGIPPPRVGGQLGRCRNSRDPGLVFFPVLCCRVPLPHPGKTLPLLASCSVRLCTSKSVNSWDWNTQNRSQSLPQVKLLQERTLIRTRVLNHQTPFRFREFC